MSTDFCYYEGNLEFLIPLGKYDSLIEDLRILCAGHWALKDKRKQLKANFSDEFKASKLYGHKLLFRQYYWLGHLESKDNKVIGYVLSVDFSVRSDYEFIDTFVEYLKPYLDKSLYSDDRGYIGTIEKEFYENEDNTYIYKEYYISDYLKDTQDSMKYLCEGCKAFTSNYLCRNLDFCKRAYDLGEAAGKINAVLEGEF